MRIFALFLLTCLAFTTASAQKDDLREDSLFFLEQEKNYQSWLNATGLGKSFSSKGLYILENSIVLQLEFLSAPEDTAIWALKRLRSDYLLQSGFPLEEELFYRMVSLLEITPPQAIIQIRNTPGTDGLPAIDFRIEYDLIEQRVGTKGFLRSTVKDSVFIPAFALSTSYNQSNKWIDVNTVSDNRRYAISQKIAAKFSEYFAQKTERRFIIPRCRNPVMCEVMNVKGEVVPPGFFGITDPYERLVFTIDVQPEKNGLRIFCTVDGKYGSGLFRPRTVQGFRDMFPEYHAELSRYTEHFTQFILYDWIIQIIKADK